MSNQDASDAFVHSLEKGESLTTYRNGLFPDYEWLNRWLDFPDPDPAIRCTCTIPLSSIAWIDRFASVSGYSRSLIIARIFVKMEQYMYSEFMSDSGITSEKLRSLLIDD